MSVVVRRAEVADAKGLPSLVRAYWEFEGIAGFDASRIAALLASLLARPELGQCWVAEEGGELVGYLLAVYMFSLEHGGVMAEIDEIFVVPERRSLKIGAALLDAATAVMMQLGIAQLQLQLGRGNARGQRFYEQQGFERLSGYELLRKSLRLDRAARRVDSTTLPG
ncbi:MAG TPA: GNAT family N-acetyltransferase [Steroidobacteraceae bacterium]|jgi:GNAT superfamily N-acetyltransferase